MWHILNNKWTQIGHDLYVAGDYILTKLGGSCQTHGLVPIETETKCKQLVSRFQNNYPTISYKNKIDIYERPKGCFAIVRGDSFGIYFNEHINGGKADSRAISLCYDLNGKASISY